MKKTILIACAVLLGLTSFAQKAKFGHVDTNAIFAAMPEREAATKEVEKYAMSLESQLQLLNKELETKYNDYMANSETFGPAIKQMKEEELVNLQQRIQQFQMRAQEDMQNKEAELLEPIYKKITDSIKQIGEEKALIYVFDVSTLLFYSAESIDVTPDVKIKLGIK